MGADAEYRPTLFDRHGPVAGTYVVAGGFGIMAFALVFPVASSHGVTLRSLALSVLAGVLTGGSGLVLGHIVSRATTRFVFGGGTTPYMPQHSYEDSLIQKGRLEDALASFEAKIAEYPEAADVRFRAAELYAKREDSLNRAAELFREAQRVPRVSIGDDVYATNRLVGLLIGPLNDPSRALVELRQLIDRHPGTAAAQRARETLALLKTRYVPPID